MRTMMKRTEHFIGKYKVTLVYDDQGIIGAIIEGPRLSRAIYIALSEAISIRLPKPVRKFLERHGFNIK